MHIYYIQIKMTVVQSSQFKVHNTFHNMTGSLKILYV